MALRPVTVTQEFADMAQLEAINYEAFPKEERMTLSQMLALVQKGQLVITALYAEQVLVGFFAVMADARTAYLFFLAIAKNQRGQGYGAEAVALMQATYADKQLVLDMEPVVPAAQNLVQRQARLRFYQRQGFKDTGYTLAYLGLEMAVLVSNQPFAPDAFNAMLQGQRRRVQFTLRPPKTAR